MRTYDPAREPYPAGGLPRRSQAKVWTERLIYIVLVGAVAILYAAATGFPPITF